MAGGVGGAQGVDTPRLTQFLNRKFRGIRPGCFQVLFDRGHDPAFATRNIVFL